MAEMAISTYTYEAYLAVEAESQFKYEFHDGMITAMAGGTPEHGLIAGNFIGDVSGHLREKSNSCGVFSSDVKVHIEATNRSYYPDASIVCGKFETSDKDQNAITNPLLILEVLSESTAAFDRGTKFTHYRSISSLKEYVLIRQDKPVVDTYYRTENGTWEIQTITGLAENVTLKSIDAVISMQDIYRLVPGIS